MRWRWLVRNRDKICLKWDLPDGSLGRDTHICLLPRGHSGQDHQCKCGATWVGES